MASSRPRTRFSTTRGTSLRTAAFSYPRAVYASAGSARSDVGSPAVTDPTRGPPSSAAISPNISPDPRSAIGVPLRVSRTRPRPRRKPPPGGSPSSKSFCPAPSVTRDAEAASRRTCSGVSPFNIETLRMTSSIITLLDSVWASAVEFPGEVRPGKPVTCSGTPGVAYLAHPDAECLVETRPFADPLIGGRRPERDADDRRNGWRKGWDLNPRTLFWRVSRLAGDCLRPTRPPFRTSEQRPHREQRCSTGG